MRAAAACAAVSHRDCAGSGRTRRAAFPEMSVVVASMFACQGIVWSSCLPRRRYCCRTARMPGSCGTCVSSRICGGVRDAGRCRVCRNAAVSSPRPGRRTRGLPKICDRAAAGDPRSRPGYGELFRRDTPPPAVAEDRARRSYSGSSSFRLVAGVAWAGLAVRIPKVGWVRFRGSRPVPEGVESFRVTRDRAGRWHVAFAATPDPVEAPGNGDGGRVSTGASPCPPPCLRGRC